MAELAGRRVLVTRPEAGELSRLLLAAGAVPVSIPVIRLLPLLGPAELERLRRRVGEGHFDILVFTSANAVRQLDLRPPAGATVELFAIGPGTAAAARELGWDPPAVPARYVAESLTELLIERGVGGRRVLLPRAAGARQLLPRELERAGAAVEVVDLYSAQPDPDSAPMLLAELRSGAPDWVTFTSSSTVAGFRALASGSRLPPRSRVACIGPVTAASAREAGLEPAVVAEVHSLPGLVAAMAALPVNDNRALNGLP